MDTKLPTTELILALDVAEKEEALQKLNSIGDSLSWVKIGLQLFTRYGPEIVFSIADLGYKIFLDLKLYDIPNQVAGAVKSLSQLPIHILTLHASGGTEMIQRALEAAHSKKDPITLLGVTVLTSFDAASLKNLDISRTPQDQVLHLAELGLKAGLKGFVCSPQELRQVRKTLGPEPTLVTPGVRPQGAELFDQKRIATPTSAAQDGASFIVVGRPILHSTDAKATIQKINEELQSVTNNV